MKSKSTALVLCLLGGGIGVHMFYLNRNFSGIMRLMFFWTLIPALIAFVEIFHFAMMSEETFNKAYNAGSAPATGPGAADDLVKLANLFEKKLLTEDEFRDKKIELLKKIG